MVAFLSGEGTNESEKEPAGAVKDLLSESPTSTADVVTRADEGDKRTNKDDVLSSANPDSMASPTQDSIDSRQQKLPHSPSSTGDLSHSHHSSSIAQRRDAVRSRMKNFGRISEHGGVHLLEGKETTTKRPLGLRHLFKKPVIHQYFADNKLKRVAEPRESFDWELWLDLVYVGVLHQLAGNTIDDITTSQGINVGTYLILYYPSFLIWSDIRLFFNHSGVDDIIQRLFLLVTMFLLIGYTGNVTAVSNADYGVFSDGGFSPYRAAIAFLLVASLLRLIRFVLYAIMMRKFALYFAAQCAILLCTSAFFIPLCFIRNEAAFIYLPPIACLAGAVALTTMGMVFHRISRNELNKRIWVPAMNYEHFIRRTSDFVVLVLGETVLSSTYSAAVDQIGLSGEFGRATLSISISFVLAWLYFAQASARRYVHAMRRNFLTQSIWIFLHFTLTASLVLVGAASGAMVSTVFDATNANDHTALQALRWVVGGGIAATLSIMASLAHTHRSLDVAGSSLIPREVRILSRYGAAAICATVPLAGGLQDTTRALAVYACTLYALLIIEVFGKLHAWAPDEEERQTSFDIAEEGKHIIGPSISVL